MARYQQNRREFLRRNDLVRVNKGPGSAQKIVRRSNPSLRVIGAETRVSLSDRFTQIARKVSIRSTVNSGSRMKSRNIRNIQSKNIADKKRRQDTFNNRRSGLFTNQRKFGGNKRVTDNINKKKNYTNGATSKGNRRKSSESDGKGGQAIDTTKLDMEMDAYWFQAGKGPDPKTLQLDRQLDNYWAKRPDTSREKESNNSPFKNESNNMADDD